MEIDKETYKIGSESYYVTKHKKNQIILAASLRKENYHIKRLTKKDYGKSKEWPTFTISREGKIYQHYAPSMFSSFMNNKDIDKSSISIVLENMGMVYYDHATEKYYSWTADICNEDLIYEKSWKGNRYWERYTDEQFKSTVELCKFLCEKHSILLDCIGNNVHYDTTANFKGIVTRSNYDMDYNDLNPSFNYRKFLDELGIEYE